jgi:NAD+ synthase/NAD+ synthase (glutamine-hydrolysing)
MKIALLQLNPKVGDLQGNAAQICTGVLRAEATGADLVVTPEMALLGYPPRDLLLYPAFVEQAGIVLQDLGRSLSQSIPVVVGTVTPNPALEGRSLLNGAAWLERGEIRHWVHKCLLPTYDVFDEDRYFEPNCKPEVIPFQGWQLGFSICEDAWNDRDFWQHRRYALDPVEELAKAGAEVLINLSASPFSLGRQHLRVQMLSAMARKHEIPILYANQVGGNDDLIFDGASFAVDRTGAVFARAAMFQPDQLLLDLDLGSGAITEWPQTSAQELYEALVLGTRDYVSKCGFQQVLLGLSGGIDSAITAAIAVAALGSENVLGVLMPSPYSSLSSLEDAWALADNLGMATTKLPIQPVMQAFTDLLAEPFAGLPSDITEENLQSRIRGTTLMALSNKLGRMLLTTGNKSELAVGYCTIYGDMSGGLAVISDVPKTQVYALAHWINREQEVIPLSTLTKPPSAELRPDQKDTDSLPAYEILDEILSRHIEQHQSAPELIAAGFDRETVERVLRMVKIAEFKRHQAAPGLRVTDRAFGSGWRMPIARS